MNPGVREKSGQVAHLPRLVARLLGELPPRARLPLLGGRGREPCRDLVEVPVGRVPVLADQDDAGISGLRGIEEGEDGGGAGVGDVLEGGRRAPGENDGVPRERHDAARVDLLAGRPLRTVHRATTSTGPSPSSLHLRADPAGVPHHHDGGLFRSDVPPGRGRRLRHADRTDPVALGVVMVVGEREEEQVGQPVSDPGGRLHPEREDPREEVPRPHEFGLGRPLVPEALEDGGGLGERRRRDAGPNRRREDEGAPLAAELEARVCPVGEAVPLAEAQVEPAREGTAEHGVRHPERRLVRTAPRGGGVSRSGSPTGPNPAGRRW